MSTAADDDLGALAMSRPPTDDDTIYALSTGATGAAGVAVIRISGPEAQAALGVLLNGPPAAAAADRPAQALPGPRRAALRKLYDPRDDELLDEALVLWFPGPRSFTGEDVVELQTHGSRAVVSSVLGALAGLSDGADAGTEVGLAAMRPAERGEFTQRAFSNGQLGLTEVEGLADLLAADTAAQRRQALRQMGGATERQFWAWREVLQSCLAHTEAVIDFGDDEEDVDEGAFEALAPKVQALRDEVAAHLRDARRGEIVRDGLELTIVGPPNAGKSTLLNLLARRDAAIVADIPGTTRDVLEVRLDVGGVAVIARDTAGLRTLSTDPIEVEGMRRARAAAQGAQLVLFVVDASQPAEAEAAVLQLMTETDGEEDRGDFDYDFDIDMDMNADVVLVCNKADLARSDDEQNGDAALGPVLAALSEKGLVPVTTARVSCMTGDGVEELLVAVQGQVEEVCGNLKDKEPALLTRERHRRHAAGCLVALDSFLEAQGSMPIELAAEELRVAARELGRVVGAIDVEEVLDVLFRDFCIGK